VPEGSPPPFTLSAPLDGTSPFILASPHSGRHIPLACVAHFRLPLPALRRIEDAHVDALVAPAAAAIGAPLIAATHARTIIDLNRHEREYDPAMVEGPMPHPPMQTERIGRGYGLVPKLAGTAHPIHAGRMPAAELVQRIENLHRPWHRALAAGLAAARARHGAALLVDCHSMPPLDLPHRADLVIGDRHGQSASPAITAMLASLFRAAGLKVVLNSPYAGGHISAAHGAPPAGVHALQLEFCRRLYMSSDTLEPHDGFARLQELIASVLKEVRLDGGQAQAAE